MPPEPDNKIEELLKAYAKKRGAEAGAPFELHPATRQLLQSEVARLRPQAAARASWLELVIKFWPRLGFAASILAVLLGVVWMVNQGGDQTRQLAKSLPTSEPEFLTNPNPLAKNPDRNEAARDRGAVSISEPPPASPAPVHRPAIQLSLEEVRADSEAGKVEVLKGASQLKLARSEESEKQLRADRKSGSELSQVTRSFSDEFGRKDQSPPAPATAAPEMFYRNLGEKKGAGTGSLNRGFAPGAAQPVSELPSSSVRVAGTTAASPASGNVEKEVGPSPSGAVGGSAAALDLANDVTLPDIAKPC